jgi:L-rhamnose isomerase
VDKVLLHVSRGVRWDSDHVITWDDELQRIMNEIVWNDVTNRVFIGLDYFDASINRIAAWVIGMRNARKALLWSCLVPYKAMQKAEREGDLTGRLALMENARTLPFGAVWDAYCVKNGIPTDGEWLEIVRDYEKEVLSKR